MAFLNTCSKLSCEWNSTLVEDWWRNPASQAMARIWEALQTWTGPSKSISHLNQPTALTWQAANFTFRPKEVWHDRKNETGKPTGIRSSCCSNIAASSPPEANPPSQINQKKYKKEPAAAVETCFYKVRWYNDVFVHAPRFLRKGNRFFFTANEWKKRDTQIVSMMILSKEVCLSRYIYMCVCVVFIFIWYIYTHSYE